MPSVSETKKLQKRMRLLDEAYKLFMEKGVNMTAIDDVVKQAGVAKGTFYLYFRDKYDLFDQIITYKSAGIIRNAISSLYYESEKCEMSFVEKILYFTDNIIAHLIENRDIVPLINKNLTSFYSLLVEDSNSELKHYVDDFVAILEEQGFTKKSAEINLYMLTNMIGSVCCEAILYGKPYNIDEVKEEIHSMIRKIFQ